MVEASAGPLAGIQVLDLSRVLSGPFCTMLLADLGSEVIKVERPGRGDQARGLGPRVDGDAVYFMSVNRGKKSVTLDIFSEEGRRLARELARRVDVLVENYVPGTLARLGLDYDTLAPLNPGLIYASITGFGQDGPYAQRPALDIIVQGMGGMMSVTGEPGGPPLRPGASLGDSIAGLFTALGIAAALRERERTGKGRYIDIGMLDCQVTMMENALARNFATGQVPGPLGSRHPAATPFQAFATSDGYIVVALLSDEREPWRSFCQAIGLPELVDDPRYQDGWSRTQHYEDLGPVMEEAIRQKPSEEWLKELSALGIPCGPVNNIAQVVKDPQVRHRGMVAEIAHPNLGVWRVANTPVRMRGVKTGPQGPSPRLGEHTEETLRNLLGLSDRDIVRLREQDVV